MFDVFLCIWYTIFMKKDMFTINKNGLSYGRGYVYSLQYHLVWCTKYRKKVLQNGLDEECKKMLYEIADEYKFQIVAMEVMPDHIHLLVDCKPQFYISDMIKIMKGNLARQLFLSHPELKRELWGGHLWNPSYCAVTVSDRSKEQVLTYIKGQKEKEAGLYLTITALYEQQKYMYDNKIHSVEHRIVSITQPWLRPIVRGKVKAPVEFGAKFDLSLDSEGYGRIEKISFEAYNESTCLTEAVERFKERTGYYPNRVLADQIYRTRANRNYCKEHGIRLSGPKLGRPGENVKVDKKQEYQDNTDRIEVERTFSLSKRCYGMSCITTKLEKTQLTSIALSVFVTNLFKMQRRILFSFLHLYRI